MERIDDLNIAGLKVIQNTDYFMFGIDSVMLANTVKTGKKDIVIDLCTGSGVIPILVNAKQEPTKLIGLELQQEMYDLAKRNIELNNLEEKIDVYNIDIREIKSIRKLLMDRYGKDTVDCITCNPPYKEIGTGIKIDHGVRDIARNEVMCTLEDVFKTSSGLLKSRGKLYMVHKPERLVDLIYLSRQYNLELKEIRFMQPNIDKKPSIVLLEFVKDGGHECNVREILIQYDNNGKHSEEIMKIYEEGNNG
ncbi:MAG: tRNA1(Val) (adenine(37)-N6)-methyltransferase [Clostridia bacterium]|nr:tRNA1(Val) (adenine(37)-N6)-methyltransferase [Clostridia bacterium]